MPSDESQSTNRRTSFSASSTFNSLLGRSNTTSAAISPFPGPITTAAAHDQRRRMSSSGTSPIQSSGVFARRTSISTNNSDTITESAIDDEDGPATSGPNTPFARRMSKAAEEVLNGSNALRKNLASNGRPLFPTQAAAAPKQGKQASMTSSNRAVSDTGRSGEGFNWSEQVRSRAQSSVSSAGRPSFSNPSPTAEKNSPPAAIHGRANSVTQLPKQPAPPQTFKERIYSKPDEIGERMLKGDYYY